MYVVGNEEWGIKGMGDSWESAFKDANDKLEATGWFDEWGFWWPSMSQSLEAKEARKRIREYQRAPYIRSIVGKEWDKKENK